MTPRRIAALAWLHPPLFVLAPVLALYSLNRSEIPARDLIRPSAALLAAVALVLLLLVKALRRDLRGVALGLSLFLLAFFAFPYFTEGPGPILAYLLDTGHTPLGFFSVAAWAATVAAALIPAACIRRGRDLSTQVMAVFGATLCAQPLWRLVTPPPPVGADVSTAPSAPAPGAPAPAAPPKVAPTRPDRQTPDIVYLVLDAYGRADVLRHFYGFDNAPFLDQLRRRGFTVAEHSQANYLQTLLALTAALNLDYVQNVTRGQRFDGAAGLAGYIADNAVVRRLRRAGYRLVAVPTGMPETSLPSADVTLTISRTEAEHTGWSALEGLLIEMTPFALVPRPDNSEWEKHRQSVRYAFAALPRAAALPYPKLVIAHILAPHPPFAFTADGRPTQPPGQAFSFTDASGLKGKVSPQAYRDGYIGQVRFVNAQVLAAVDGILKAATRPTVIVLQGDHGPRQRTDWYSLKGTDTDEPFRNFTAIRLPDSQPGDTDAIDRLTPVNTFRFLLRTRFGDDLPPLPDKSYYSTLDHSFDFVEVPDARPLLP